MGEWEPVGVELPPGSEVVVDAFYPTDDPDYLTDDLFSARLPSGRHVDVAWYPEHDPAGCFHVRVYEADFARVVAETKTRDWREARDAAQELARRFAD